MNVYRVLAILIVLIGALVIAVATQRMISDDRVQLPLHCTSDGCRAILPDGTLSQTTYPQPEVSR